MNIDDWHALIHRHADGLATPAEAAALCDRLREDPALRAVYLDCMNLDVALAAVADAKPFDADIVPTAAATRPAWLRPLTAVAAGLVIGLLSARAVWALTSPRVAAFRELPLVNPSFESVPALTLGGVPHRVGVWAGDPGEILAAHGSVKPRDGARMVRFLAAAPGGDREGSKPMASDLWQVIDLPGTGPRTVKVRAWFNAETQKVARFHLAAAVGDGDAASARNLWGRYLNDSEAALAAARTMVFVDHDPATWESGELVLHVPHHARVLLIGIAAYRLPVAPPAQWFPAQFVDDVSVTISDAPSASSEIP